MTQRAFYTERAVWLGLGLTAALLLLTCLLAFLNLAGRGKSLPVYGQVHDFALTNQNDTAVTLSNLHGHVWVADIIFTRCAGPCLKMSKQMKDLQEALAPESGTRLVTLTTDPEYDQPPVLKKYAERFGASPGRWTFLTGSKSQIASLATDSLKLSAIEKEASERSSPNDLFIHSTILVLVDRHARLRGIYETTGEGVDPQQVRAGLLADIRRLERER